MSIWEIDNILVQQHKKTGEFHSMNATTIQEQIIDVFSTAGLTSSRSNVYKFKD